MLKFEWDHEKAKANKSKHGVAFEEASSVFFDDRALQYYDPDHSEDEDRFLILGQSEKMRTLTVCHCFRENEEVIRIISARKATKLEQQAYWSQS